MAIGDYSTFMAVGGGFIVLGIVGIIWGRHEEKSYFNSLSSRRDMREFMDHWPERPQPGALRTGGWIAIVVGLMMLVVGLILWFIGLPL